MSLGLKSSPEGPATPMQKALASEVVRARLRSRASGTLRGPHRAGVPVQVGKGR